MTVFDLKASLERARDRLGDDPPSRRPRSDRGRSRLDPRVRDALSQLLQGQERPPVREIRAALGEYCATLGLRAPARATIYQAIEHTVPRSYDIARLPTPARESLYNLDAKGSVPGHQLAFYCLNYGGLAAASFAAGLPWLALHQASRLPGWRRRSRGVLDAILHVRRI
jgi:hypothetical protein